MTCSRRGGRVASASRSVRVLALLTLGMGVAYADDQHPKVQVKGPTSVTANPSSSLSGVSSSLLMPQIKSSRSALRASSSTGGPLGPGAVQETLRPGTAGAVQSSSTTGPGSQDATTVKREQAQPLPK